MSEIAAKDMEISSEVSCEDKKKDEQTSDCATQDDCFSESDDASDDSTSTKPDKEPCTTNDTKLDTNDKTKDEECPQCHCRKRRRTGGFPFGRDPAEAANHSRKPKEDPKTQWGKFQRQYAEKYKDLNSSGATTALARVYYVPVHSNGTSSPKSLERLLRETHHFIQPWTKGMTDADKAKSLREWTESLLHNAIINHHNLSKQRTLNP